MNPTSTYETASETAANSRSIRRESSDKNVLQEILLMADIRINGSRTWDIRVYDERFFNRVLAEGTLGFGESYMDGWWDCEALDEMFFRAIRNKLSERIKLNLFALISVAQSKFLNLQTERRSRRVAKLHYDLGNEFFKTMLDPAMQYSCAYFQDTLDLAAAQQRKLDLICRKLALEPGMRLLDIGCGWGGLAEYAAKHHGCRVVGVTISREQHAYATALCEGLPVEIRLQDYRRISESFDRVVSVGMMEHVGPKNYLTYMKKVAASLCDDGLFLCHTIGDSISSTHSDRWISRYIFPNSLLPSPSQIIRASEGHFVLEDVHNFGTHYDQTLCAWENRFREAWPQFETRYGERFYRMWRFYLLSCAAAFRARSIQLYQIVFSKQGVLGGYECPR